MKTIKDERRHEVCCETAAWKRYGHKADCTGITDWRGNCVFGNVGNVFILFIIQPHFYRTITDATDIKAFDEPTNVSRFVNYMLKKHKHYSIMPTRPEHLLMFAPKSWLFVTTYDFPLSFTNWIWSYWLPNNLMLTQCVIPRDSATTRWVRILTNRN